MRKLAIAVALATTVLAAPAVARDNSGYVGSRRRWNDCREYPHELPVRPRSISAEFNGIDFHHHVGFDVDLIGGYDFGLFRVEGELGYKHAGLKEVGFGPAPSE